MTVIVRSAVIDQDWSQVRLPCKQSCCSL